MTRLVKGRHALFTIADDQRFARDAHQDLVLCAFKILVRDRFLVHPGSVQRRFVDQIGEVGARKARRTSRDHRDIDVFRQRDLPNMNGEDAFAALHIGSGHNHAPVKAAGAEQRRIQDVGPVGRRNQDDAFVGFESVHFHKQLVEGLLALVMSSAEARSAMPPNRIDFIYKDDARRVFLPLFKQIANPRCAHADEHFHEIRSTDREKRHIGFARDRSRQKGLSGPGGADQQDALWNASTELLEFLRFFQKINNFL